MIYQHATAEADRTIAEALNERVKADRKKAKKIKKTGKKGKASKPKPDSDAKA